MAMAARDSDQERTLNAGAFRGTLSSLVVRFKVFNTLVTLWVRSASTIGLTVAVILLLFILHQLFLWVDRDPEKAFDNAAFALELIEVIWDVLGIINNAVIDICNAALIPMWNSFTYYAVEPLVILILEIFSLVFFDRHYGGVIDETSFPYQGIDCTSSVTAMQWCGRYRAYEQSLIQGESGFVNKSTIFLGLKTARRLSELSGTGDFATPVFDIDIVTDALLKVATLGIVAVAPLADIATAILDDVLSTAAVAIFDAVWLLMEGLLNTCALRPCPPPPPSPRRLPACHLRLTTPSRRERRAVKLLVKSGMLTFVVGVGIDFLVIYFIYYALPLFFAGLDLIMCIVDFFFPAGWGDQLQCASRNCFNGPSAMTDLLIFTSVPVILKQFGTILEVTLNSGTGVRFAGNCACATCIRQRARSQCRHACSHVLFARMQLLTMPVLELLICCKPSTPPPRWLIAQRASSVR